MNETAIYNLALNAIGARNNVSSPTENSREAEVCRLWYAPVRDQILAGAAWPEATRFQSLAMLGEATEVQWVDTDPRPGYEFVYAIPADCLRPQYLTDFSRFLISYYADNKKALHTSTANAVLAYTMRLENANLWSAELQMAIVYGLAAHICMPLSGKPTRMRSLVAEANSLLMSARESAANASTEVFETIPDWLTARGYIGSQTSTRYYHPFGSLLAMTSDVN